MEGNDFNDWPAGLGGQEELRHVTTVDENGLPLPNQYLQSYENISGYGGKQEPLIQNHNNLNLFQSNPLSVAHSNLHQHQGPQAKQTLFPLASSCFPGLHGDFLEYQSSSINPQQLLLPHNSWQPPPTASSMTSASSLNDMPSLSSSSTTSGSSHNYTYAIPLHNHLRPSKHQRRKIPSSRSSSSFSDTPIKQRKSNAGKTGSAKAEPRQAMAQFENALKSSYPKLSKGFQQHSEMLFAQFKLLIDQEIAEGNLEAGFDEMSLATSSTQETQLSSDLVDSISPIDAGSLVSSTPRPYPLDTQDLKHMGAEPEERVKYFCTFPNCSVMRKVCKCRTKTCKCPKRRGTYSSHSKVDLRRHEEGEKHWPQENFMCLECPSTVEYPDGVTLCSFCFIPFSELGEPRSHYLRCELARQNGKTFGRKDHLCSHLKTEHRLSDMGEQTKSWSFPIDSDWPRQCGFCGIFFKTWDQRMKHISEHFDKGSDIHDWKLPFLGPKDTKPLGPFTKYRKDEDDDDDDDTFGGNGGGSGGNIFGHGMSAFASQSAQQGQTYSSQQNEQIHYQQGNKMNLSESAMPLNRFIQVFSSKHGRWVQAKVQFDTGTTDNWISASVAKDLGILPRAVPTASYRTASGDKLCSSEILRGVTCLNVGKSDTFTVDFRIVTPNMAFDVLFGAVAMHQRRDPAMKTHNSTQQEGNRGTEPSLTLGRSFKLSLALERYLIDPGDRVPGLSASSQSATVELNQSKPQGTSPVMDSPRYEGQAGTREVQSQSVPGGGTTESVDMADPAGQGPQQYDEQRAKDLRDQFQTSLSTKRLNGLDRLRSRNASPPSVETASPIPSPSPRSRSSISPRSHIFDAPTSYASLRNSAKIPSPSVDSASQKFRNLLTSLSLLPTKTVPKALPDPASFIAQPSNESNPLFTKPTDIRPNLGSIGREKELAHVHKLLFDRKGRTASSSAVLIQPVRGEGKTHLTRRYIYNRNQDIPGGVFWLRAKNQTELGAGFGDLKHSMELVQLGENAGTSCNAELSAIDQKWGILFDEGLSHDGHPTKKLGQFLRGLANHTIDGFHLSKSIVITPAEMARYNEDHDIGRESKSLSSIFREHSNKEMSKLYQELGYQDYSVQGCFALLTVPALKPLGFVPWMKIQTVACLDEARTKPDGSLHTELESPTAVIDPPGTENQKNHQESSLSVSLRPEENDDPWTFRSMARRKRGANNDDAQLNHCRDPDCDKEFKPACDLTKHEKTYSRPWKCPVETCTYHETGWPTEKERSKHHNDKHPTGLTELLDSKHECIPMQENLERHDWKQIRSKEDGAQGSADQITNIQFIDHSALCMDSVPPSNVDEVQISDVVARAYDQRLDKYGRAIFVNCAAERFQRLPHGPPPPPSLGHPRSANTALGPLPLPLYVCPPLPPRAQPFTLSTRQQINSTRIIDITPRKFLDEDACRKRLTSYEAYTLQKTSPNDSKERPTWARSEMIKETLSQQDILKAVKRLNESKCSVQDKKATLTLSQQGKVSCLLDELLTTDPDANFEWSLAQIDRAGLTDKRGQKETTTVTVYVKRAPQVHLNPSVLYKVFEERKQEKLKHMNTPPPRPDPPQRKDTQDGTLQDHASQLRSSIYTQRLDKFGRAVSIADHNAYLSSRHMSNDYEESGFDLYPDPQNMYFPQQFPPASLQNFETEHSGLYPFPRQEYPSSLGFNYPVCAKAPQYAETPYPRALSPYHSTASGCSATSSSLGSPYSFHGQIAPSPEWMSPRLSLRPSIMGYSDFVRSNEYSFDGPDFEIDFSPSRSFVDPSILYPLSRTRLPSDAGASSSLNSQNTSYPYPPTRRLSDTGTRSPPPSLKLPNTSYPYPPPRRSSVVSRQSYSGQDDGNFFGSESIQKGRCAHPTCGRVFKDLKAHTLTHQTDKPEKCPIQTCDYHIKGFARKYDKNRHTLTHYKGTMVCGFCPGSGLAAEKSFNRADVFKRHLNSVHAIEQTPPNSRKKKTTLSNGKWLSGYATDATGKCSTCSAMFSNPQDFYEHLDECVLRIVQEQARARAIDHKDTDTLTDHKHNITCKSKASAKMSSNQAEVSSKEQSLKRKKPAMSQTSLPLIERLQHTDRQENSVSTMYPLPVPAEKISIAASLYGLYIRASAEPARHLRSLHSCPTSENSPFDFTESVNSHQSDTTEGLRPRQRVQLSPKTKARAALIRHRGSCLACRARMVLCPLEHHDVASLEFQLRNQKSHVPCLLLNLFDDGAAYGSRFIDLTRSFRDKNAMPSPRFNDFGLRKGEAPHQVVHEILRNNYQDVSNNTEGLSIFESFATIDNVKSKIQDNKGDCLDEQDPKYCLAPSEPDSPIYNQRHDKFGRAIDSVENAELQEPEDQDLLNSNESSSRDEHNHHLLFPGVYVPTLCFFDPVTEDLDTATVASHAVRLAKAGVTGLTMPGSNGVHLPHSERQAITSVTRSSFARPDFSIYATNGPTLPTSVPSRSVWHRVRDESSPHKTCRPLEQWACPSCFKTISSTRTPVLNADNCTCAEFGTASSYHHVPASYVSSKSPSLSEGLEHDIVRNNTFLPLSPKFSPNGVGHSRSASFHSDIFYQMRRFLSLQKFLEVQRSDQVGCRHHPTGEHAGLLGEDIRIRSSPFVGSGSKRRKLNGYDARDDTSRHTDGSWNAMRNYWVRQPDHHVGGSDADVNIDLE